MHLYCVYFIASFCSLSNNGVPSPVTGSHPSTASHPAPGMTGAFAPLKLLPLHPSDLPCVILENASISASFSLNGAQGTISYSVNASLAPRYSQGFKNPNGGLPILRRLSLMTEIMEANKGAEALILC